MFCRWRRALTTGAILAGGEGETSQGVHLRGAQRQRTVTAGEGAGTWRGGASTVKSRLTRAIGSRLVSNR